MNLTTAELADLLAAIAPEYRKATDVARQMGLSIDTLKAMCERLAGPMRKPTGTLLVDVRALNRAIEEDGR